MKPTKFEKNKVNFDEFTPDISTEELAGTLAGPDMILGPPWFFSIDTLSVTKTVGKGRTNLTFIKPEIVQADAATPYAGFNRQNSPQRNPLIQMHFDPAAYGATAASTYVMVFSIEAFGSSTFNLQGYAGAGTLANTGSRVLNGKQTASLTFKNVPPSQIIYGYLEQTAGAAWNYYSTSIRHPLIILQ
ncbi:hypothetical protein [Spirosoma validum]|uniref:Uncharacterized protein n=1 Tax=Spirosoma validum TaxID=2771355 RepID=A0A927AYQ1_9BACT|nr:hypothetical protein [Spirosoma validum]MBD2752219.1 hypothetical protein [Spirosoma validum]